jgi:type I restriction-modification system DNA methylase subunit
MPTYAEKLIQDRRHEQELRGYPTSSRWYTGLSNAISFLERAETADDPKEHFFEAWLAAYNLLMMHGGPGDEEFKRFGRWVTTVIDVPRVRELIQDPSLAQFRDAVKKAEKALLFDTEKKRPREGRQHLEAWSKGVLSADKAIRYFLIIIRDIRNACAHAEFNPSAAATKRALSASADSLIPIVAAAIRATIEHPVEGTTGRTTAYRSTLWPYIINSDSIFSDYYLERLFPNEELASFEEDEAKTLLKEIAKRVDSIRTSLVSADAEETKSNWCEGVLFSALGIKANSGVRIVAQTGVFEPDYVLTKGERSRKPRDEYQGKDAGGELTCLVWVLPWRSELDAVQTNGEGDVLPMDLAQRALTASDVQWAVLTNGQKLRLLHKSTAHKPRSFLEVDLAAVMDRRDAEALLAFRYCLGLFSGASFTEKDDNGRTRLERAVMESARHGKEISDELKQNVFHALEELGDGFLAFLRSNHDALKAWREKKDFSGSLDSFLHSDELLTDIYHESLSLMYRLLFLFYAESRNLLPMENEMYRESYSLESIRDDIISVLDDPDPKSFFGKGNTSLWDRLKELFGFVDKGWGEIIPAYNGGLFDPEQHEFLERFKVGDHYLARAIDLLSRTRPRSGQQRGEGRKKITYRDLEIRHLGSIYEGILEYSALIADEDKVVIKRGSGSNAAEEYASISELSRDEKQQIKEWQEAKDENPDSPRLPRGCKIVDRKEKGRYFLVFGGRESKRKSSGSYYTPDYIVQYIVDNTIGPLVRGENREAEMKGVPLNSDEILELRVLDPAMGSGHFLVAATEYLARAYGYALIREGKDKDGLMTDEEFIRYKRMVAERCIYGVDVNEMAVELAKLSMWLFTMDRGRPLSFLDHHLKCGNSLLGAPLDKLGEPPFISHNARSNKAKSARRGQGNLFEHHFRARVPTMIRDVFGIMSRETLFPADISAKKLLDRAIEDTKRPFKAVADVWMGILFGEAANDYSSLLSNVSQLRNRSALGVKKRFFHWQLEFPEVYFDANGSELDNAGFSAVVGNPPYGAFFTYDERPVLKDLRPAATDKELESYWLFMHLAGFEVSSRRGLSSLVVPITWLTVPTVRTLRERLLTERSIDRITLMPKDAFGDVGVETAVYVSMPEEARSIKVFLEWPSTDYNELAPSMCRKNDGSKIIYWLANHEIELMQRIQESSVKLGAYAYVTSGYEAYVVGKGEDLTGRPFTKATIGAKVYHSNESRRGFGRDLSGGDIKRYGLSWNGQRWVKYGHWLSVPRNKDVFTKPRILVQEITGDAGKVKATYTDEEFYFSRDILCVLNRDEGPDMPLLVVLAIINSRLFYFYHNARSAKAKKALFPKLLIEDVKDVPLPKCLVEGADDHVREALKRIVVLVKRRLKAKTAEENVLDASIDESVLALFNIGPADRSTIAGLADSRSAEAQANNEKRL